MEDNFQALVLVTIEKDNDRAAVLCALESLEKYEIIKCAEVEVEEEAKNKKIWTLLRPLESMPQNLELPQDLAGMMATVINEFSTAIGRRDSYCDPTQITQENVRDLIFITNFYLNGGPEEDDKKH
ncbi:hypothetical protein CL634_00185 [bacterium]|nr:hypothetical protein [bacterium]